MAPAGGGHGASRRQRVSLDRWLRKHGRVLTLAEADALGINKAARARLVRDERLRRPMRGVLVDATAPETPELATLIAWRAAGDGALVSHHSAAWLLGLLPHPPALPHVTVPRQRRARLPGVVVHQSEDQWDRVMQAGMAVTSPSRTLLEIAAELSAGELTAAIERALTEGLTAVPKLVQAAGDPRRRRRPGTYRLMETLRSEGFLGPTDQSALERRLAQLINGLQAAEGLPPPQREVPIDGGRFRLDFAWPPLKLAVEGDGYAWHWSPKDKERDEQRRNHLAALGWTVVVFTWRQVTRDPELVARTILANYRRALAASR